MSEPGLLTEDNPTTEAWHSEENGEFIGNKGWKTADDAVNSYRELEKSMGGRVKMPGEESTPEEVSAFYRKLGAPEESSGYSRPELPEGHEVDEEFFGKMAVLAHKTGVSDKQFKTFIDGYVEMQAVKAEQKLTSDNQESATTDTKLHEEWGADYDKNLKTSNRVLELIPEDIREEYWSLIKEKNLDNNLIFIKGRQAIGAQMLDDTLVKGELPKPKDGYVPQFANSPELYQFGEGEDDAKARDYFKAKGHVYS